MIMHTLTYTQREREEKTHNMKRHERERESVQHKIKSGKMKWTGKKGIEHSGTQQQQKQQRINEQLRTLTSSNCTGGICLPMLCSPLLLLFFSFFLLMLMPFNSARFLFSLWALFHIVPIRILFCSSPLGVFLFMFYRNYLFAAHTKGE